MHITSRNTLALAIVLTQVCACGGVTIDLGQLAAIDAQAGGSATTGAGATTGAATTGGSGTGTTTGGSGTTSGGTNTTTGGACTDTWTTFAKSFFAQNCLACHHTTDFTAYAQVQGDAATVRDYISTGFMPEGATLPADLKARILAWFDCNLPE